MSPGDAAFPPAPAADLPPDPTAGPATPADVLRWCGAAAPGLWFPSAHAKQTGVSRDSLDDPVYTLRQAGLIRVADWVRGLGQGYALTPAGEQALADPVRPPPPAPDPEAATPPPDAVLTPYDRGELTREAFLAPRPAVVVPALLFLVGTWYLVGAVTAWRIGAPVGQYLWRGDVTTMLRVGAADGPDVLRGEWWRLVTCGFVHAGLLHLVGNLFGIALLGPVAEGLWGRWRFVGLYVLSGVAAAAAAVAVHPTAVVAGASGSVWGLMLAVVAWLIRYREHLPTAARAEWVRRMVLVIGVNLVLSLLPGVSWEGHLAGAAAGFAAAVFLDLTRPGASLRRVLAGVVGLAGLVAAVAGGLTAAVRYDPDWQAVRAGPAVGPEAPADPARLLQPVGPGRVWAVHRTGTVALAARTPEQLALARAAAAGLRADAEQLAGPVHSTGSQPAGEYLTHLVQFARLLDARLADGRLPTAEEWKTLADQRDQVLARWPAATGQAEVRLIVNPRLPFRFLR